ncbi:MAG: tRNA (adenosine(37)-N6)-threonylcarbamoyltransferase complex ATPase subunit type 1 TsaE [Acidimicrobiales bacterium]|nr:tRNA (adenosine(37)-N6)-threonylcarbamoyltransferase complex ATPase subunit type 1 TsaE [Acidimicrobiales bacterium]
MFEVATTSAAGTRAVAAAVAGQVRAGDLLVLAGDLGAGKTAFTQGFGAALGVEVPITSPTFTLAQRYEGRLRVHHLDVYRLSGPEEAADLDIADLLEDEAVTLIEWGDTIRPALPPDFLEVRFTLGEGDDDRSIAFTAVGPGWTDRLPALAEAIAEVVPC